MLIGRVLCDENCEFKPFKSDVKLKNFIFKTFQSYKYFIFSSSHCKIPRMCTIDIILEPSNIHDILKFQELLKRYTWNFSNNQIKTTENDISYTLKSLLIREKINIAYNYSIISDKRVILLTKFNIYILKPIISSKMILDIT